MMLAFASAAISAEPITFIACPIYRDTDAGRKSGCWLADDPATGLRFDVSAAPMKPQVGHQVLVEGYVSTDSDACGGVTLRPVRASLLEAICSKVIIPPERYPGRRFNVPDDALKPTWEPRTLPPPPYVPTDFHIFFDFGNDFLVYQHSEIVLEKALLYAQAGKARQISVTGFAATAPILVSGTTLKESMQLARRRAEAVALSLERMGVPRERLKVTWRGAPQSVISSDAPTPEASKRRVTIHVIPRVLDRGTK